MRLRLRTLLFCLGTASMALACSDGATATQPTPTDDAGDQDAEVPTECEQGLTKCGATCVDLASPDHCGTCENVCPAGANGAARSCTAGQCTSGCKGGSRLCSKKNACENESASSCGTACTTCPAPPSNGYASCDDHACGIVCAAGYGSCSSGCCATHVVDVALGEGHACTLDTLGHVKCWGDDLNGQTGDNPTFHASNTDHITLAPYPVTLPAAATKIAAASDRSCAILTTGAMMCWGYSGDGGLGNASAFNTATPVVVTGVISPTAIGLGQQHTCAVVSGGVKCWGTNDAGQLGNNGSTAMKYLTAVDVVGITNAIAVAAGYSHTCAVTSVGTVKCWGSALALGNPAVTINAKTPVDVPGLTGVVGIAAGRGHTCAVTSGGAVKCWGANSSGQIGNGGTATATSPVDATTSGTAVAVSAGTYLSCALLSSGQTQCWGDNGHGQIGDGTTLGRTTPTTNGLSALAAITAGTYVSCSVATDGTTRCNGSKGGVTRSSVDVLAPTVIQNLP